MAASKRTTAASPALMMPWHRTRTLPAPTNAEEYIAQVIVPARRAYRLGMYSSGFAMNAFRFVSAIGAVLVPILSSATSKSPWFQDAVFVDGLLIALAVTCLNIFRFSDRYRVDRFMAFSLADEVRLHAAQAGAYDGLEDAARFKLLVVRVETLLRKSMEEIVTVLVREPSAPAHSVHR